MQNERLYKDSKKEALFDQLCRSLEGDDGRPKMHIIKKHVGEPDEQAKKRYYEEEGFFIRDGDLVLFINTFGDSSNYKPEDDSYVRPDEKPKPSDKVNERPTYPPPGAFGKPEEYEQDSTPEKVDPPLKEKEERETIRIPGMDRPITGPNAWMV